MSKPERTDDRNTDYLLGITSSSR